MSKPNSYVPPPIPPNLGVLSPEAIRRITEIEGPLGDVNRLADDIGTSISGHFNFNVRTESHDQTVQKLAVMINFLLESTRQAISRRERAESIIKGQAFLRQLIDLQNDLIYTKDERGRFILVNRSTAKFYGVTPEEMVGKRRVELGISEVDAAASFKKHQKVMETKQPYPTEEEQVISPSGQTYWFQTSRVPVLDEDGHVIQVLYVSTDITALKQASDEMSRLISELQQALKFKDQFLATMSHELRTPLNAIIGFAGICLMSGEAPPQTTMMLERIDFNARRLANLINDVLDISRINAGRVEILWTKVDIRQLAQTWHTDYVQRITGKGVQFILDIDPALPIEVDGDSERLTQIANNLLTNATKFTDKGSVTLALQKQGENWAMTVKDTGIGISETFQQVVFEEFRQVEAGAQSKYGGTGLGLAIVQKLCILMDGQITVSSKLGEGSTFSATFPLRRGITKKE